ncbi:hypothetical protein GGR56DRAFT_538648 [Xylariaceae sp. FL0804]|nr:hypothetical protein GGR56DRAFT_538648 [Xylariaceae sp. FL0804]
MASSALASSLRSMSLRTTWSSRPAFRTPIPQLARSISHSVLTPATRLRPFNSSQTATVARTAKPATIQLQTRGIKVHSAVRKRCEHCKVSSHEARRTLTV